MVPALEENLDGLKYLEGKALTKISNKALRATITAHEAGGIPVMELDFLRMRKNLAFPKECWGILCSF